MKLYQKFTHPEMFKQQLSRGSPRPARVSRSRSPATRALLDADCPTQPGRPRPIPRRHRAARGGRQAGRPPRAVPRQLQGRAGVARLARATASRLLGLPRRRRAAAQELERSPRRNPRAPQRARRGLGPDRRAQVPLLDPAELPAQRRRLLLHAAARPERREMVAARQGGGPLRLPVLGRRAAGVFGHRRTPPARW